MAIRLLSKEAGESSSIGSPVMMSRFIASAEISFLFLSLNILSFLCFFSSVLFFFLLILFNFMLSFRASIMKFLSFSQATCLNCLSSFALFSEPLHMVSFLFLQTFLIFIVPFFSFKLPFFFFFLSPFFREIFLAFSVSCTKKADNSRETGSFLALVKDGTSLPAHPVKKPGYQGFLLRSTLQKLLPFLFFKFQTSITGQLGLKCKIEELGQFIP